MLPDLTADLRDLVETVRVIEHDPYRYGLELDEVERRRKLVQEVGLEIENMREELVKTVAMTTTTSATPASSTGATAAAAASGLPNPSDFDALLSPDATGDSARGAGDDDDDDDYYSSYGQQRQVQLMQSQDQQLDGVLRTVGNLRQQADHMGRELEDQGVMLDDVDTLADRVGGKLQNGVKKIGQIVRKNEGEIWFRNFTYLPTPHYIGK
jgi:t-SNARE syntaxin family protein